MTANGYFDFTRYTLNLTTTFTLSAPCSAPTYTLPPDGNDTVLPGVIMAVRGFTPECYPSGPMQTATVLSARGGSDTLYSPGICFEGYETKASSITGDTTFATCCPPSMELMATGNCSKVMTTSITVINRTETSTYTGTFFEKASSIVVGWQSADMSLLVTSSIPASTGAGLTAVGSPTSTSSVGATGTPEALSTAAKAALGVGISIGSVLVTALIGMLLWRRHKRKSQKAQETTGDVAPAWEDKAELPGEGKQRAELGGLDEAVHEVPGSAKPHEADATVVVELEGDSVIWEAPTSPAARELGERTPLEKRSAWP